MHLQDHPSTSVSFPCNRGIFLQLPSTFRAFTGHSVNLRHLSVRQQDLPSNFHAFKGPSVHFCQIFMHPQIFRHLPSTFRAQRELPSTFYASAEPSVNFLCVRGTFYLYLSNLRASLGPSAIYRQLSRHPQDLPSIYVNILCVRGTFHQLPSTFHALAGPSVSFCQLSMCPRCILSTSINFPCIAVPSLNFHQLSLHSQDLSISVNFWCVHETFRQFLSTFRASTELSINLHQLSVRTRDLPSTFGVFIGPFVNFRQPSMHPWTFCQLPSTLHASAGPSVNFRRIFVCSRDHLSTPVKFPCVHKFFANFRQTFCVAAGTSVNVGQLSRHQQDLP